MPIARGLTVFLGSVGIRSFRDLRLSVCKGELKCMLTIRAGVSECMDRWVVVDCNELDCF